MFLGAYAFLLQATVPKGVAEGREDFTLRQAIKTVAINGLCATPLMLVLMSTFQAISGDLPGRFPKTKWLAYSFNVSLAQMFSNLLFFNPEPGLPTTNRTFLAVLTAFALAGLYPLLARPKDNRLKSISKR